MSSNTPEVSRYHPLLLILVAAAAGIAIDHARPLPAPVWWLVSVVACVGWLCLVGRLSRAVDGQDWQRRKNTAAGICLSISILALGGAWHHVRWNLFAADDLAVFATEEPRPVQIHRAKLVATPQRIAAKPADPLNAIPGGERMRITLAAESIRWGDGWRTASGRTTLLVDGHVLGLAVGDRVEIFGQLSTPQAPLNPGEFNFAEQRRAAGELSQLWAEHPACVTLIERPSGWSFWRGLAAVRERGIEQLARRIRLARQPTADALLLGTRTQLDEDLVQAYFLSGMVHLLSISGLHVGILAVGLFWFLRLGLGARKFAIAGVALITIAYALIIEAEPPAVRATVMVLLACGSMLMGRQPLAFNVLAGAALVVLAINPADLFHIGPQLSFLAAGVLAWFATRRSRTPTIDPLDRLIARTRPWPLRAARRVGQNIWRALVITVSVWLVTLPLVMTRFHLVSPVAILLTPVLALPIAIGLMAGFGVLLTGWLLPPLGMLCGWVCDMALAFADGCVELGSHWPGNHFWVLGPRMGWVLSMYALIALALALPRWRPRKNWCLAIVVVWSMIGLAAPLVAPRDKSQLACTFLSLGHGCAAVIELPGGRTLMYDCGRIGSPVGAAKVIAGYLWDRGITHLDAVVISHADVDHYNGLPGLVPQFRIDRVYATSRHLGSSQFAGRHFAQDAHDGRRGRTQSGGRRPVASRSRLHAAGVASSAGWRSRQRQRQQHRAGANVSRPHDPADRRSRIARPRTLNVLTPTQC